MREISSVLFIHMLTSEKNSGITFCADFIQKRKTIFLKRPELGACLKLEHVCTSTCLHTAFTVYPASTHFSVNFSSEENRNRNTIFTPYLWLLE
jgi:hypothetical protein